MRWKGSQIVKSSAYPLVEFGPLSVDKRELLKGLKQRWFREILGVSRVSFGNLALARGDPRCGITG